MRRAEPEACRAWQLLVKFFFAQREHLPFPDYKFKTKTVVIEPGRPMPMGRLAETLSCDASNVTGLIDRLEARGLVRRVPSVQDRRVKVLELTQAGARLRAQMLARMAKRSLPLGRLSREQQRTLVKILEELVSEQSA